jgi:hypothetical protein
MKVQLERAKEKGINVKVCYELPHNEKQPEDSNIT